jgi:hypothetical protein
MQYLMASVYKISILSEYKPSIKRQILYSTKMKTLLSCIIYSGWSYSFLTSAAKMGSRWKRCLSWADRSDDLPERCGRIPCISYLVQSARPSLSSNTFCGLLRTLVGLIWFFKQAFCQVIFVLLNAYWREDGCVSHEYAWHFVKCTFHTDQALNFPVISSRHGSTENRALLLLCLDSLPLRYVYHAVA